MKTIKTIFLALATIAIIAQGSAALAVPGSLSASFLASVNTGRAPLTVQFTDTSGGAPTGWQWDFGDGSYSTLQNPVYTYNMEGTYDVTLTVTDGATTCTSCSQVVVNAPLAATPTPGYGRVPVIVEPIVVPVKDPHHARPPLDSPPPAKEQPPHKSPAKPTDRPTPTDKPKHK